MSALVNVELIYPIAIITLNDPDRRNALTDPMIEDLIAAFSQVGADKEIRCVILTGAGSSFCAGGSIKDMRDRTGYAGGNPANGWRYMTERFQQIPRALAALDVPVVAAVNGAAIGAGCDIATMCDIRLASENASFAESFIRLGVISGDGGTWFLTRAVGASRAAEMTLTGDSIDSATAAAWGLVSRVVTEGSLLAEAVTLAKRIARNSPNAIRMAKRLLRVAAEQPLQPTLELAAAMQGVLLHTDDQRESVSAMLEKRPAVFRNN